jgi:hypothetical protein
VTATPSGGKSPYTYLWSIVSDDGHVFTINNPTSATTTVKVEEMTSGTGATCTIACVCHDSTGLTATSANVIVLLNRPPGGGPNPF